MPERQDGNAGPEGKLRARCLAVGVAHTAMDVGGDGWRPGQAEATCARRWRRRSAGRLVPLGSGENLASQEMRGRGRGGGPYVNEHFL